MADDIVTDVEGLRLIAWSLEGGNVKMADECRRAAAEIERLRQAIWDACAILGMDTDGNATPRHLIYPPLDELIVSEARRARQDYDDLLEELEARRG